MAAPFRPLSAREFRSEAVAFRWSRRIWRVDLHHTGHTAKADYRGLSTIEDIQSRHRERLRLDDIAQHVSIAPDGVVWTGRDWNRVPASVGNGMSSGAFMVEMIGNFDRGHDRLEAAQLESTLYVIETIQCRFGLPVHALLFHREVPQTDFSCPGTGIEKRDLLLKLMARRPREADHAEISAVA